MENEQLKRQYESAIQIKSMKQLDENNFRERLENKAIRGQKQVFSQNRQNYSKDLIKQSAPPMLLINTTKNDSNLSKIINKLDRSMDSSMKKKSGTPQLPFPNTKSTEDSNASKVKESKWNNMSVHKKQDSMNLASNEVDKFHTPSLKADMNLTFNKGSKFGAEPKPKFPQSSKISSNLSKNPNLRELLGKDVGTQMITPSSNQRTEKTSKFNINLN